MTFSITVYCQTQGKQPFVDITFSGDKSGCLFYKDYKNYSEEKLLEKN